MPTSNVEYGLALEIHVLAEVRIAMDDVVLGPSSVIGDIGVEL